MFGKHVQEKLHAYCEGELNGAEVERVAEHLLRCRRCRESLERERLGRALASQLVRVSAPDDLWAAVEASLDGGARARANGGRRWSLVAWPAAALAACLVVVFVGASYWTPEKSGDGPSWGVVSLGGAPEIGAAPVVTEGRLGVGEWLETDERSRARIAVANIGRVDVEPNSRVRLVDTGPEAHRLALERGTLNALVVAPPRLFFVDTPSAVAVDYGCAYTLTVDEHGATLLRVTAGWVALMLDGRESMVPSGAICETRPSLGPGTPYFEDASLSFREALRRLDFEGGGAAALQVVLDESRRRDALTLWHLLPRLPQADRALVYDRLAVFVPPPPGTTREGVLGLDREAIDAWGDRIGARAYGA